MAVSIGSLGPRNTTRRLPLISHRLAVSSRLAVRIWRPSGLNTALLMLPSCPSGNSANRLPLVSHKRAVLDPLIVRIWLLSGLNTALWAVNPAALAALVLGTDN